jgi:hypothetical protein
LCRTKRVNYERRYHRIQRKKLGIGRMVSVSFFFVHFVKVSFIKSVFLIVSIVSSLQTLKNKSYYKNKKERERE